MIISVFDRVENNVLKAYFPDTSKCVIEWEWVKAVGVIFLCPRIERWGGILFYHCPSVHPSVCTNLTFSHYS